MTGEVEVPSDWAAQVREWSADYVVGVHGPTDLGSSFDFADDSRPLLALFLMRMLRSESSDGSDYVLGDGEKSGSACFVWFLSDGGNVLPVWGIYGCAISD